MPTDDEIDASTTLAALRTHENKILASTRSHEDALARLQTLYKHVRAKMYRDHKLAVIAEDNAKLQRFQGGCSKPREAVGATKEQLDAQAACLQREAREIDDSDLGLLMRRHLKPPVAPLPPGTSCTAFRQVDLSQVSSRVRGCLSRVGDARWTAEGLVDAPPTALDSSTAAADPMAAGGGAASGDAAARAGVTGWGRRRRGACSVARTCILRQPVVRRPTCTRCLTCSRAAAHRQLNNFTDVKLPEYTDAASIARSWIWDQTT